MRAPLTRGLLAREQSVPNVVFAIPGNIETASGGYGYDRRVLELLPAYGIAVSHLELPGSFPTPSSADLVVAGSLLTATPASSVLLIDGLAYGAIPATMIEELSRDVIALVHHPVGYETGLAEARAEELIAMERAALALARHVVVTSSSTKRTLERDFAVPSKKITVAEPGTDPAPRATGTGTPLQMLAVGAISKRKAYDILVRALVPLAELDWRLTIAGATDRDVAAVDMLDATIATARLGNRVTLAGKVVPATLDRLYESADLLVMPSLYEGYGMVLAEAMARGLPIVCTTGGAAADTVPGNAAIKVPPGDPQALSVALRDVLENKKLRIRMADASWDAGRALPTWNETARRIAATILGMSV